jgi:hypothetical protein
MNDCVRLGGLHGTPHSCRIEAIRNERLAAELPDEMSSFLRPRCAHDLSLLVRRRSSSREGRAMR